MKAIQVYAIVVTTVLFTMTCNVYGATSQGKKAWTDPVTGMEFVWVEGGCFPMGQTDAGKQELIKELGRESYQEHYTDALPRHEVCVDGFWMGQYEVTNRQYKIWERKHESTQYRGYSLDEDEQPVVEVGWDEAKAFAAWLTIRNQGKYAFRLPTEAEWEYAARAGTTTSRFWGDDPADACQYANVHDSASQQAIHWDRLPHSCDDGYVVTAPVGSFRPNTFGLYDMLGNVYEWCEDTYSPAAYTLHQRHNPIYHGADVNRVVRGCNVSDAPRNCRAAFRHSHGAATGNVGIGFRLVVEAVTVTSTAPSLSEYTQQEQIDRLIQELLQNPQPEARHARHNIALELGTIGAPALQRLTALLTDTSQQPAMRMLAMEALGSIGSPAIDFLVPVLTHGDKHARIMAVMALGYTRDPRVVESILTVFQDESYDVRMYGTQTLDLIGIFRADPLIPLLQNEEPRVREWAAAKLGEIGDPLSVKPLSALLKDDEKQVRKQVVLTLGKIGAPALDSLLEALIDDDQFVRRYAAEALGEIGDPRAIELLILTLGDERPMVRMQAAEALRKIGSPAIDPLTAALKSEDPNVRELAAETLKKIQ
jgi:formylglycine-generating enzyme required for sulfatase activity/HEAT repeat protein